MTPEEEVQLVHVTLKLRALPSAYYDNPVTDQRERWTHGKSVTVMGTSRQVRTWRTYPNPWQAMTTSVNGIRPIFDDPNFAID